MSTSATRRKFLKTSANALAGASLMGCGSPHVAKNPKVRLGVNGYARDGFEKALKALEFTKKTGIKVELLERPNSANDLMVRLTGAFHAGITPYDVLDFEDTFISLYRAGWFLPLDDIFPEDFWEDFTDPMMEMIRIWYQYSGETFRIPHNFEPCYWWYRKDWFEQKKLDVPKTWEDVNNLGQVFRDPKKGKWATEEGLQKRSYLEVYIAWITRQAGGDIYQIDDSLTTALEYIYELIYKHNAMNPACLQKNYDQVNNDYMGDRVAFLRQWPFFYDVTRQNKSWYSDEKVVCSVPPIGPAGKENSTYAAAWGYGIPKYANDVDAAKELIRFFVDKENAAKLTEFSTWFLTARHSVLNNIQERGTIKFLKLYLDEGIIRPRSFHPKYSEALTVIEDFSSAFLTKQISLKQAVQLSKQKLEQLV